MKTRSIEINAKHNGKPCPKKKFELSNCEKEGFADNSVPDCDDSKDSKPSSWSEWNSWTGCKGYCGKKGKVIVTNRVRNIQFSIINKF